MRKVFLNETLSAWIDPATRVSSAESRPRVHAEIEDWALRAAARNGFGGEPLPRANSVELQAAARRAAQAGWAALMARGARRVVAVTRLLRRRLRHAAQLRQLEALDASALRDLGLDRSEIGSLHAEIHGHAAPTRRLVAEHDWFRLRAGIASERWASR